MMHWLLYEEGETDEKTLLNEILLLAPDIQILFCHDKESIDQITPGDMVIAYASLATLRELVHTVISKDAVLAVLPRKDNEVYTKAFNIPKREDEALALIFSKEASAVDLLFVNEIPVFSHVSIGEMSRMWSKASHSKSLTSTQRGKAISLKKGWFKLNSIGFKPFTIKTMKEQHIQTAAVGITLIENINSPILHYAFKSELDEFDGQLNAFIWAPRSIFALIWHWLRMELFGKMITGPLPSSIGIIQTGALEISSAQPIEFTVDDMELGAYTIKAEVLPGQLHIIHGNGTKETVPNGQEAKERFKVSNLPRGEVIPELIIDPLPLFSHAAEEEFRDLFLQLRQSATPESSFFILMTLSTILATVGLFLNSSSVIIGAMILAPLMGPIIALSMAMARNNRSLILLSMQTLAKGMVMTLVIAALISFLMPFELVTSEMQARLHPNLLDLIVAVVSGIAGAYAYARENIAKSLPGVAIAVALVPPLTVSGIGIGLLDWQIVGGSFLLFLTNLVGIIAAGTVTFLVLGFAPIKMARKGLRATALLLALIIPPLWISFSSMSFQNKVVRELMNTHFSLGSSSVKVENAKVIQVKPLEIALNLSVSQPLSLENCDELKKKISLTLHEETKIRFSYEILR